MKQKERFEAIEAAVGNTPMLEIGLRFRGKERKVFAKAEYYNLTGSIKDRVAYYILKKAYETGEIHEGDIIAEATSGNTGISFSAMGSYLHHPVVIYMPDWMSRERISLMESYGAKVRLVSHEEGGFLGSIAMTEELAKQGGVFLPRQFSNLDNTKAHECSTGVEIAKQLEKLGKCVDGVVAGVGTGGTIMGISNYLKSVYPNCKAFPLEPLNSPTLSTGYKVGKHRIYGISDEFIPDILDLKAMEQVVSVDDGDAIYAARMLSEQLGIGVGVSSGANFLGCLLAQEYLGADSTVVTVFADDNKKYLSTDYAKQQVLQEEYLSREIELLNLKVYR